MMRWAAMLALSVALVGVCLDVGVRPRRPSSAVHGFDAALDELRAGELVLVAFDYAPADRYELQPVAERVLRRARERDLRLVALSLRPTGAMLAQQAIDAAYGRADYGAQVVNLGFLEGGLAAALAVARDLPGAFSRDHFGDPVQLRGAPSLLVSLSSGSPGALEWLLVAQGRGVAKMIAASTSTHAAQLAPFVDSGQLAGLVDGVPGLAQLEATPGYAAAPLLALAFVAAIVLGNLAPLAAAAWRRRRPS